MNNDKQGYAIILVLMAITGLIVWIMINYINHHKKTYEGAVNGQIWQTNKCYLKDDVGYCEKDNIMIRVDNFYIKED